MLRYFLLVESVFLNSWLCGFELFRGRIWILPFSYHIRNTNCFKIHDSDFVWTNINEKHLLADINDAEIQTWNSQKLTNVENV